MRVKLPKPVAAIYKSRGRTRGAVVGSLRRLGIRVGKETVRIGLAGANFLTRNEGQIHRHLPSPGDLRVEPWAPLTRAPEQGGLAARREPGAGGRAAARSQVLTFSARP